MNQEKVSIIIACYNDDKYVEQALNSAYNQTWVNKEIIVIDDGSNDKTKKVLSMLSSKIDILLTQENTGVSKARNNGIAKATGEYVLILDSDDYFELDFIEKAIPIFRDDINVKIVTCYTNWFDNNNFKIFRPNGGAIEDALLNNIAMGSSMFCRSDWEDVGGYDLSMQKGYEDWEFYIRLIKNGGIVKVIPEILFNYRNKDDSRNKQANSFKYELLKYIYLKHSDVYKKHFSFFIQEWLENVSKSEAFKQQVMDSIDYKIGNKLLKPFRLLGFFKRTKTN